MRKQHDRAKLSQSSCLLEGLCICLMRTGGDFAVIIHSYRDCANVLPRAMFANMSGPGRFFCTNILESDVMSGSSMERLAECAGLVAEMEKPLAIYVFASCLSELIGDDLESGVEEISKTLSIPVIAVTSSGLDDISQKKVIDRHAYLMYRAVKGETEVRPESVNLIGLPACGSEINEIFEAAGITVNVSLNENSHINDWMKLPSGALNAVIDQELFSTLTGTMKKEIGTPFIEIPLPAGVSATDEFFLKIASRFKKKDEMKKALEEHGAAEDRKAAIAALASRAKQWRGMKLAYNIGTDRNYVHHITANNGLSEIGFFKELGFDITLLIQGDPSPGHALFIRKTLDQMKIEAGIDIFVDCVHLTPALRKKKYDLVYCVGAMAEMVSPTKTPLVALGDLRTGYRGCLFNLDLIDKALAGRRD